MLDTNKIRKDFPILKIKSNNKPLIFFDNGASSQKPKMVLDKISLKWTNLKKWVKCLYFVLNVIL